MGITRFGLAAACGVGGGVAAALVVVLPRLGAAGRDDRLADYAGLLIVLMAVHLGSRAAAGLRPPAGFGARVGAAVLIASCASSAVGIGLYALYALLRPRLLAERYAFYVTHVRAGGVAAEQSTAALAELAARRAQHLDPSFQALAGAGTVFFCATLLGAFLAFRWRVASRLGAAGGARAGAPATGGRFWRRR